MASIAVVIPAYNAEETIGAAITSVLQQTTAPDEILVVDDGSTDQTSETAVSASDSVRVIRQQNGGAAVARQRGTEAANSEYIAYLDADDKWPPNRLEECHRILAAEPVDILLADLQRAWPDSNPGDYLPRNSTFFPEAMDYIRRWSSETAIPALYRLDQPHALRLILLGFPVYPSTLVVRRQGVFEVGGWDARFRRAQDFDFGLRATRAFPLYYLHEVHAILGLHDVNRDATPYVIKQSRGDIDVLLAHAREAPAGSPYAKQAAEALARRYCGLGYTYRTASMWDEARDAYRKALRWPGRRLHAAARLVLLMLRRWSRAT